MDVAAGLDLVPCLRFTAVEASAAPRRWRGGVQQMRYDGRDGCSPIPKVAVPSGCEQGFGVLQRGSQCAPSTLPTRPLYVHTT